MHENMLCTPGVNFISTKRWRLKHQIMALNPSPVHHFHQSLGEYLHLAEIYNDQMVLLCGNCGNQMAFKYWSIWHLTLYQPFEY